jgi:uncharacterized protein YwgA
MKDGGTEMPYAWGSQTYSSPNPDRKSLLESFVLFLKEHKLIDVEKLKDESDAGFENRLKLQKYIFIARYFGLDMGYSFSLYIHGPYSPDLARDYYALELTGGRGLPESFRKDEFLGLVLGKDSNWLEAEATALDFVESWRVRSEREAADLVEHIKMMKPHVAGYAEDAVKTALAIIKPG